MDSKLEPRASPVVSTVAAPKVSPPEAESQCFSVLTVQPEFVSHGPRFVAYALKRLRDGALPTLKYLTQTDVHTFAFSVAANAILSFFPFLVLLLTVVRRVFHSQQMYEVIGRLLRAYLPTAQDFIVDNLGKIERSHHGIQVFSLIMLLITSTGVFLPLEVALNQVWGFRNNRSYLGNQVIALGLAVACGVLALASVALTASNQVLLQHAFLGHVRNVVFAAISRTVLEFFGVLATIAIFFLIYWILPNGKVKPRWVLPAAVSVGLLQEVAKYAYILALPRLDFKAVYGPFYVSVTLMFWAFLSGMLLLGGAHLSTAGRVHPLEDAAE
jgi:membrane protein